MVQQSNAELDILFVDAGRTLVGVQGMEQGSEEGMVCLHLDMEKIGEGFVQHVEKIVPPTIDENYNRRKATARLVQPDVVASSFGVYRNHNAISTGQQEQNKEVNNLTIDGARIQEPNMYAKSWEEIVQFLTRDDIENGIGVVQPGAGPSSSGGLRHNTSENRGAPLLTGSTKLVGRAFAKNMNVIWSWLTDDEVSTIGFTGWGEPVKLQW